MFRAVALAAERELKPDTAQWRERAFDPAAWRDPATAAAIESDPAFARQRPELLFVVYRWVFLSGRSSVTFLLRLQRAHPGDVSTNLGIADALRREALGNGQPSHDAIRFAQAAVAVRPDYPVARVRHADALGDAGRVAEAVAECREAVRLDPVDRNARRALALRLADMRTRVWPPGTAVGRRSGPPFWPGAASGRTPPP